MSDITHDRKYQTDLVLDFSPQMEDVIPLMKRLMDTREARQLAVLSLNP